MDALSALLSTGVAPARPASGVDPTAATRPESADNAEAAKQVESLFAFQLLKAMRKTVPKDGLLSGGKGEDIARTLQDEMLSDAIAKRDAFGLAAQLRKGLDRLQPGPDKGAGDGMQRGAEGASGPNGTR
jgi:Rod binding domain-containing protein